MKLILIAPAGGGKGSLAELLCKEYNIPNISTGDMLRKLIAEKNPVGIKAEPYVKGGHLVPDNIMADLVAERVRAADCKNGCIFDGFPRTLGQAQSLIGKVQIDAVIELDIEDKLVMERLGGRWTDKVTGKIWNERYPNFAKAKASGNLFQREDDNPAAISKRLSDFRVNVKDILDFYKKQGILFSVKIKPEFMPEDTYKIVKAHLDKLKSKR